MTELEELQQLLKQPLPGGRGFQEAREKRIKYLHEKVMAELCQIIMDTYSLKDLAEMYLAECFGDEVDRPRLVLTSDFQEVWDAYHPEEE